MKTALLVVLGCLAVATSGRAADMPVWSLYVGPLAAVPTSPGEFTDSWGLGWGLEGGFTRSFGGRWSLGLDGRYQQFQLDVPATAGAEVLGGARRFGLASLRLAADLYRNPRGGADAVTAEVAGGYVHQSTEPVSGVAPPPTGSADGFNGSAGIVYSRTLYAETRLQLGVRHTWFVLPDETLGAIELRLGASVPLAQGRPR